MADEILSELEAELRAGFLALPEWVDAPLSREARSILSEVARRLHDNYPYFHPLYAGQMLKPPHPVARLAYTLAMTINPNNHALDGGRASSHMEKEAVTQLAAMFGWTRYLGHLTSGGTMANLEALWVSGKLQASGTLLGSAHAHYTHARISEVLGLAYESIDVDAGGRMDLAALEQRLAQGGVGTVIATLGTTGLGAVDPLADIVRLAKRHGARVHADAAYGGYFRLVGNLDTAAARAFAALPDVDSIVVDPHKHGLQPYGCGCILFRDPEVGSLYRHESPYTYFTSSELHLGEISLECSRAGASAVALWATQKLLPLVTDGEFASQLSAGRQAGLKLHQRLVADPRWLTLPAPELDIVVFAPAAPDGAGISALAARVFEAAAESDLHLALIKMQPDLLEAHWPQVAFADEESVTCLRSVMMKPEHLEWADEIWLRLGRALEAASSGVPSD